MWGAFTPCAKVEAVLFRSADHSSPTTQKGWRSGQPSDLAASIGVRQSII